MSRIQYPRIVIVVSVALLVALLAYTSSPEITEAQQTTQANQATTNETEDGSQYVTGELLVTFKEEASSNAVSELSNGVGANTKPVAPDLDIEVLEFPYVKAKGTEQRQEQSLEEAKKELEQDQLVKDVDYNYVIHPRFIPNDKLYGRQYGPQKIQAPQAWDSTLGDGVKIGIIDSGVQDDHPDLDGKVVAQRDFYSGDGTTVDNKAEDSFGHGTQVAGISAATTDNGRGIAGICPECEVVVGKFQGPDGDGSLADSLKAINFAVNNGVKVLNLSYGYVGKNSPQEEMVINRAWDRGVFITAAVYEGFPPGYYGSQKDWPAAYKRVIAVSATDKKDRKDPLANYGSYIDVTAPGVGILSTDNTGTYSLDYGTSFSAPHVAGVAGLLAGKGLSNQEIRTRIESSAIDLGKKGKDPYYGYGQVDALAAVKGTTTLKPRRCTIKGTRGADILRGTTRPDIICGFGGSDIISGGGGNDTIYGDSGNDILNGNSGSDRIFGGAGNDIMKDDAGIDKLYGGGGRDALNIRDDRGGDLADGGADRDVCSKDPRDKVVRCP